MKKRLLYMFAALAMLGTYSCNGNRNNEQSAKQEQTKGDGTVVIYLTRHGKTIFNTTDRAQGWSDTPLTEPGVAVAKDLGLGLQDTTFVAVYTSDSGRARETASLIMDANKHNKDVPRKETSDLREWYFGSFEGDFNIEKMKAIVKQTGVTVKPEDMHLNESAIDKPLPEIADAIAAADSTHQAENWDKLQTRAHRIIDEIVKETSAKGGGNVLVVCHGLIISTITYMYDPAQGKPGLKNASITKLVYKDGKFTVEDFNDMKYVEAGAKIRETQK